MFQRFAQTARYIASQRASVAGHSNVIELWANTAGMLEDLANRGAEAFGDTTVREATAEEATTALTEAPGAAEVGAEVAEGSVEVAEIMKILALSVRL